MQPQQGQPYPPPGYPNQGQPVPQGQPMPQAYPQGQPMPQAYPQGQPMPQAYPQGQPMPQAYPQGQPMPQAYPQGQPMAQDQQQYYIPQQAYYVDPNWAPPPPVGSTDPNSGYKYEYDPVHTKVTQITVEQWVQIENDVSPYSYLWSKGEFTPEKFSENQNKSDVCVDKFWAIAFWINFLVTIILCITISSVKLDPPTYTTTTSTTYSYRFSQVTSIAHKLDEQMSRANTGTTTDPPYQTEEDVIESIKTSLVKAIGIGIGVGIGLNVIHFLYMAFIPRFYVKFGLWIGVALIILMCLIPYFIIPDEPVVAYTMFGFAGLLLLIAICVYCCIKDYIEFTCMVFDKAMGIEKRHPMIFVVVFIQIIIELLVNAAFCAALAFIVINHWSYYLYIYFALSYYWVIATNYYVFYLISANLAANSYFLEGTEFFPENPLWHSVKRAVTTTFGSASIAGFIAAIMTWLELTAQQMMDSDNTIASIIGCILYCILCCLQALFHHVSRYGLFYVTVYNIPFFEGARRFTEIQVKKFITTFMSENILDSALGMNSWLFCMMSIAIGVAIAWTTTVDLFNKNKNVEALFTIIFYPVAIIMFTEVFLSVILNPADTISYALFICFTEYPERLKVVNNCQYEVFVYHYAVSTARASKAELPPKPENMVYYQQ